MKKLRKSAKKFEGARSPYTLSGGKKAWYRKEGGKWKYDSMVTPAEEKDWQEAWEKKQKLRTIKEKTAETEKKLKEQHEQLKKDVAAKKASGPTQADIAAAGTRTKLYYDSSTSDRAKKLCDLTGILCLDTTAEDYVEGNLNTIFQMTDEQKKDVRGMNPQYPLDMDGKFSDDPIFMEDTLKELKRYKKEIIDSGKLDEAIKEKIEAEDIKHSALPHEIDNIISHEKPYMTNAVNEWIDAIEKHENDKLMMDRLRAVDENIMTGARQFSKLPGTISDLVVEDIWEVNYDYNKSIWERLTKEAQEVLTLLGLDEIKINARSIEQDSFKSLIFAALSPGGVDVLEPYFNGYTYRDKSGVLKTAVGGANRERTGYYNNDVPIIKGSDSYWDYKIFKEGAKKLRDKYPALAKLTTKITAAFNVNNYDREATSFALSRDMHDYIQGDIYSGSPLPYLSLHVEDSDDWNLVGSMVNDVLKETNKKNLAFKTIEQIQKTANILGKVKIKDTTDYVQNEVNKYYPYLSQPMKNQIILESDSIKGNLPMMLGEQIYGARADKNYSPVEFSKDRYQITSGIIGYKNVSRNKYYGIRYQGSRRRRGPGSGTAEAEVFGENVKLKAALKQKFAMRFSVMAGEYSRQRGASEVHSEHYAGAALLAAIATNWQVRKLAKKAKAIPDWRWGNGLPYSKNNPLRLLDDSVYQDRFTSSSFTKDMFEKLVTDARNTSIAANIGLMKQELKKESSSGIRDPEIVLRTNADGIKAWQDKIEKEWTHGGSYPVSSMKVKGVFDIMYHPYYEKYKAIEQSRGNVQYAWHGTDFEAGSKIIKTGYMVPHRAKTGRSLGDGTYVSTSSSKVAGYFLNGHWGRGGHGVMFWNRIAMGNVKNSQTGSVTGNAPGGKVNTTYVPGRANGGTMYDWPEHCIHADSGGMNYNLVPIQWVDIGPV